MSETKTAWVSRVLGVDLAHRQDGTAKGRAGLGTALTEWNAVRSHVVETLHGIAKEIADARLPESAESIIELKAVIANLAGEPSTEQKVSEMRAWLEKDDVVDEVSELADDIRTPLLGALDHISACLV